MSNRIEVGTLRTPAGRALQVCVVPDTNPGSGGLATGDLANHGHVFSQQGAPTSFIGGGAAWLAIAPPPPYPGPFWSTMQDDVIGQIWVLGGTGGGTQTVEVGWKTSAILGSLTFVGGPYLFVGATQDDYTPDFCENGVKTAGTHACVTWVSNPSAGLALGEDLAVSTVGGTQRDLMVEVQLDCIPSLAGHGPTFCTWDVVAGALPARSGSSYWAGKRSQFTYNTTAAAGSADWTNWFYYGNKQ